MARALFLNEDLTEAIALGHDLGHTPFGHAGEDVLRQCFSPDFAHYKQSLRVVEKLERDGAGLNLTFEVRDGIVNHTGKHIAATLEGRIVKFADRIAYINHDIDDAVRARVLRLEDIPKELTDVLGKTHSERIETMVTSVISASTGINDITMEDEVYKATMALRDFMMESVYTNPIAKREEKRAMDLLFKLYEYFVKHPEAMPEEYLREGEDSTERRVCDYISGMTDRYAIKLFEDLFVPKEWNVN
jgi:dGTPase